MVLLMIQWSSRCLPKAHSWLHEVGVGLHASVVYGPSLCSGAGILSCVVGPWGAVVVLAPVSCFAYSGSGCRKESGCQVSGSGLA